MFYRIILTSLYILLTGCIMQPKEKEISLPDDQDRKSLEPEFKKYINLERSFPKSSLYKLLLAEFALRRGQYPVALSSYLEQIEILRDPKVSAYATKLASFMGERTSAIRSAKIWVEIEPENPLANLTLGELLIPTANPLNAVPHLYLAAEGGLQANFPMLAQQYRRLDKEKRLELSDRLGSIKNKLPKNIDLLLALAILHESKEQLTESIEILDRILKINPDHPQAILMTSSIKLKEGRSNALYEIEKALKRNPDNSNLRLEYAKILTRLDLKKARVQFEILSAEMPKNSELLLSLALINKEMSDLTSAKAYLLKLIGNNQKKDEARSFLAQIAETEGDLQEAIKQYLLVTDGAEFLHASSRIGSILLRSKSLDLFTTHFNNIRRRYPHRGEQLFSIEADLLNKSKLYDLSLEVFSRGIDLYPESINLRYNRSIIAEMHDDLILAEKDLRIIISADPSNATALNALGYTLANRTDRLEEARQLISKALELQPNEPAIMDSMGWVLYRQKQHSQALEFLKAAYELLPDPEVAAHIGEVLWVTGEKEAARKIWTKAIRQAPEHKVLKETIYRFTTKEIQLDT